MLRDNLIIDEKYFNLEIDPRFPLKIPENGWQCFTNYFIKRPKTCFIYLIKCNGHLYVGGDEKGQRIIFHRSKLLKGKHYNCSIQNAYNKYGIQSFFYSPLIQIPEEYKTFRNEIENSYIKLFNTFVGANADGFNLVEFADTPWLGRKFSLEHRQKISKANMGKLSAILKGRKQDSAIIAKLVEANLKTHTLIDPDGNVVVIDNLPIFCKQNNLCYQYIVSISNGSRDQCHKGWRPNLKKYIGVKHIINPFLFYFTLISPAGDIIEISNLKKFARENNLSDINLRKLKNGYQYQYLGWRRFNDKLVGIAIDNDPCDNLMSKERRNRHKIKYGLCL